MTLFELTAVLVVLLVAFIVSTGLFLLLVILNATLSFIFDKVELHKNKKESFDKIYPVGALFRTRIEQKFPYGKWKLLGKDQHGCYLYERTK